MSIYKVNCLKLSNQKYISCYLRLQTQEIVLVPDSGQDERILVAQDKCLVSADVFSATAKRISLT